MSRYNLIFVLNDGTELTGRNKINEHLDLFPSGILEKAKPICFDAAKKSDDWNHSDVRVYQNGKIETKYNIPSEPPFNDYFD
jgi:hypothetical protein